MKIGNPADKPAGATAPVAPVRNQPAEAAKAQETAAVAGAATDPSAKVELSNTAASVTSSSSGPEL